MFEKFTIDMLTQEGVSVKKQQYIVQDGKEYAIGEPWRRAYINNISDRERILELPSDVQNAIFAIWGDIPTKQDENTD